MSRTKDWITPSPSRVTILALTSMGMTFPSLFVASASNTRAPSVSNRLTISSVHTALSD